MTWYAVGLPDSRPRILYEGKDDRHAAAQLMDGEVFIPIPGPGDFVISADGKEANLRKQPIEELRLIAIERVRTVRQFRAGSEMIHPELGAYKLDSSSRELITSLAQVASHDLDFSFNYKRLDGTYIALDAAQCLELHRFMLDFTRIGFEYAEQLKQRIEEAQSESELGAINLDSDWP